MSESRYARVSIVYVNHANPLVGTETVFGRFLEEANHCYEVFGMNEKCKDVSYALGFMYAQMIYGALRLN